MAMESKDSAIECEDMAIESKGVAIKCEDMEIESKDVDIGFSNLSLEQFPNNGVKSLTLPKTKYVRMLFQVDLGMEDEDEKELGANNTSNEESKVVEKNEKERVYKPLKSQEKIESSFNKNSSLACNSTSLKSVMAKHYETKKRASKHVHFSAFKPQVHYYEDNVTKKRASKHVHFSPFKPQVYYYEVVKEFFSRL